jgi:hypothetical protein
MSDPLASFLASLGTAAVLTPEEHAKHNAKASRAQATRNCRAKKVAERDEALASVDGDRESLCRIHVWVPLDPSNEEDAKLIRDTRYEPKEYMFQATDRKTWHETKDDSKRFIKMREDSGCTQYKLVEQIIPRARHPDEEIAWAKMQGRYRKPTNSTATFFADPTVVTRKDRYQPLGTFEWCERSEELTREQQMTHSLAKLRASRPIRNVREAV